MNEMKNNRKNQKTTLILIIVVLIFNTVSILGIFFILNRRIGNLERTVLQLINQQPDKAAGIAAEPLNIDSAGYQFLGSASAPVEMTIITDLECPYCQKLYPMLFPSLTDKFIDRGLLKLEYAPFPLESKHPRAMPAALALHCADKQGQLWPMFHYLSAGISELDEGQILTPSVDIIDNIAAFAACVDSEENSARIRALKADYSEAGVKGTPTILVNGQRLTGFSGFDDIAGYIDEQLRSDGRKISLKAAAEAVESGEIGILDVRTADEFSAGHLPGAVNIDYFDAEGFAAGIAELPTDKIWLVYCKSGTRSTRAWHILKEAGFSELNNMADGFDGWSAAGYTESTR